MVDSITVGTERNERLKCLSLATGGYAFHPKTLREALRLNELETVLCSGVRANVDEAKDSAVELVSFARARALVSCFFILFGVYAA